jgi:hypothetical protein
MNIGLCNPGKLLTPPGFEIYVGATTPLVGVGRFELPTCGLRIGCFAFKLFVVNGSRLACVLHFRAKWGEDLATELATGFAGG